MAMGKKFTAEQREQAIQSLKPFLEMGFSRNKACALTGMKPNTLSSWIKEDETLGMKIQGWENTINALAMSNVHSAIAHEAEQNDGKKENSWRWLERKEESFKPKSESEHIFETPIPILATLDVQSNDSDEENN